MSGLKGNNSLTISMDTLKAALQAHLNERVFRPESPMTLVNLEIDTAKTTEAGGVLVFVAYLAERPG